MWLVIKVHQMYFTYKRRCKTERVIYSFCEWFFPMLNFYAFLESMIHDKHFAHFSKISTSIRRTHVEVWIKNKLCYSFKLIIYLFPFCIAFHIVFCTKIIVFILKISSCLYLFESLVCNICISISWHAVCACAFMCKTHS